MLTNNLGHLGARASDAKGAFLIVACASDKNLDAAKMVQIANTEGCTIFRKRSIP